jgi:hypothetical protein
MEGTTVTWLSEESARRAQRLLQPGSGRCYQCDNDIVRYRTSGTDRLTKFDEDDHGNWYRDPIYGLMHRLGREDVTNLDRYTLHQCPDEPALD